MGGGSRLQPLQAKAHPADRLNQTVTSRFAKLAAEIPDMDVDHVAPWVEMHVPHLLEQLGPANDFLRMEQ